MVNREMLKHEFIIVRTVGNELESEELGYESLV